MYEKAQSLKNILLYFQLLQCICCGLDERKCLSGLLLSVFGLLPYVAENLFGRDFNWIRKGFQFPSNAIVFLFEWILGCVWMCVVIRCTCVCTLL